MPDNDRMLVLAALTRRQLAHVLRRLREPPRRGRPWSRSRRQRVLIACAALRTNLTIRELAACFDPQRDLIGWARAAILDHDDDLLDEIGREVAAAMPGAIMAREGLTLRP